MSKKQVLKTLEANFLFKPPGLHLLAHVKSKRWLLSQKNVITTWCFYVN